MTKGEGFTERTMGAVTIGERKSLEIPQAPRMCFFSGILDLENEFHLVSLWVYLNFWI